MLLLLCHPQARLEELRAKAAEDAAAAAEAAGEEAAEPAAESPEVSLDEPLVDVEAEVRTGLFQYKLQLKK